MKKVAEEMVEDDKYVEGDFKVDGNLDDEEEPEDELDPEMMREAREEEDVQVRGCSGQLSRAIPGGHQVRHEGVVPPHVEADGERLDGPQAAMQVPPGSSEDDPTPCD